MKGFAMAMGATKATARPRMVEHFMLMKVGRQELKVNKY